MDGRKGWGTQRYRVDTLTIMKAVAHQLFDCNLGSAAARAPTVVDGDAGEESLSQILKDDLFVNDAREVAEVGGFIVSQTQSGVAMDEGGQPPFEHIHGGADGSPEGRPGSGSTLADINFAAEAAVAGITGVAQLVLRTRGAWIGEEAGRVPGKLVHAIDGNLFLWLLLLLGLLLRRELLQKRQRNAADEPLP